MHTRAYAVIALILPAALPAWAGTGPDRILAFWRADCAPCVRELTILPRIARLHPTITLTLVVLQDTGRIAQELASWPANLQVEYFKGDQRELLARYADVPPELPLSVALRADGSVCATHAGLLGTDIVDRWALTC